MPIATPENVRLVGDAATVEIVPDRLTLWGLPLALSAMDRLAATGLLGGLVAGGVKITLMAQALPAARLVPQVLVWEKMALLTVMPEKVKVPVPVLVTVTDWGALATPTPLAKVRLVTERDTPGVAVVVVLLLPPQQVKMTNPARPAKRRTSILG